MDFIARAGSLSHKSYRLIGFVLVLCVAQVFWTCSEMSTNVELKDAVNARAERNKAYVVPDDPESQFSPRQVDLLFLNFVEHLVHSLNTFRFDSLEEQYLKVRKLFTPKMLNTVDDHYRKLIDTARQDERTSVVYPLSDAFSVAAVKSKNGRILKDTYLAHFYVLRQQSIEGLVKESSVVEVSMTVTKAQISDKNPYGFLVQGYAEKEIPNKDVGAFVDNYKKPLNQERFISQLDARYDRDGDTKGEKK